MPNPLSAPFSMFKQFGEQSNMRVQSVQNKTTQAVSGIMDTLSGGRAAPSGVTPKSLLPGNLTKTLTQVENVVVPQGLPRPAAAIVKALNPAPQSQPVAPTSEKMAPPEITTSGEVEYSEPASTGSGYRKVIKREGGI